MDLEEELRRVLRDEELDISVRTGAEWSMVAGARRRRHQRTAMAAVSGVLTASLFVGGGVALVGHETSGQLPPAAPPVATSTTETSEPSDEVRTTSLHPPGRGKAPDNYQPPPKPRVHEDPETKRPSILREPTSSSEPAPTSSTSPTSSSVPEETSQAAPTSSATAEKSAAPPS